MDLQTTSSPILKIENLPEELIRFTKRIESKDTVYHAFTHNEPIFINLVGWVKILNYDLKLGDGRVQYTARRCKDFEVPASQSVSDVHADVVRRIEEQLMRVLRNPNCAKIIARTEATRAFNAAKIADLRTCYAEPPIAHYIDLARVTVASRVSEEMLHQIKKLRPLDTGMLRRSVKIDTSTHITQMKETPVPKKTDNKIRNRFYVASPNVTRPAEQGQLNVPGAVPLAHSHKDSGRWTRPTLEAALAHAEEILNADPNLDHVAVTQIVRVVRRQKPPVSVEVVK